MESGMWNTIRKSEKTSHISFTSVFPFIFILAKIGNNIFRPNVFANDRTIFWQRSLCFAIIPREIRFKIL